MLAAMGIIEFQRWPETASACGMKMPDFAPRCMLAWEATTASQATCNFEQNQAFHFQHGWAARAKDQTSRCPPHPSSL